MTTKSIKHNYNTGTWNSWDLGVFEIPEQIQVLERMGEVTFSQIDERQETGHTENGYDVKLTKCTCPFHQETGLPCKHIYKLAFHLGKLRFNKNFIRSPKLIVDFENGFSKDWYFTIGTFHKENLDIKYTTKVIKGEKIKVLTQGDDYSFNVGAVFMDNPKAYELIWREAVLEIKYLLQIRSSYSNKKKISFYYENDVLVVDNVIDYGATTFDLFKSNHELGKLVELGNYSMRADELVKLLKTGHGILATGERLNLHELHKSL